MVTLVLGPACPWPFTEHGRREQYQAGCRCLLCRTANASYAALRRQLPAAHVDAAPARAHLRSLQAKGIGYRQAARKAGLSEALVKAIRRGEKTAIRPDTLQRILRIAPILAHGTRVPSWPTRHLVQCLEREGFTTTALAERLALHRTTLPRQDASKTVRVRTALRVRSFWNAVTAEDAGDIAEPLDQQVRENLASAQPSGTLTDSRGVARPDFHRVKAVTRRATR